MLDIHVDVSCMYQNLPKEAISLARTMNTGFDRPLQ
jgi:hypothetical protein